MYMSWGTGCPRLQKDERLPAQHSCCLLRTSPSYLSASLFQALSWLGANVEKHQCYTEKKGEAVRHVVLRGCKLIISLVLR